MTRRKGESKEDFLARQRVWFKARRATPEHRAKEREYRRKRWAEDPSFREKVKASNQKYKAKDPVAARQKAAASSRRHHTRKAFGAEGIPAYTTGNCMICGSFDEKLVQDHCHTTGTLRGRICCSCNIGVGHLEKPDGWLASALAYLTLPWSDP